MSKPNAYVTFSGGAGSPGSFTVVAPSPNIDAPVTVPSSINRTQGGSVVKFQVGQAFWETTLTLEFLSNADKNNLEAFFRNNTINGNSPANSFVYTDENSNAFTAIFLDPTLPLTKNQRDLWTSHVHLQLSAVLK